MIKNQKELGIAQKRLADYQRIISQQRKILKGKGQAPEVTAKIEVDTIAVRDKLAEEIKQYQRLKRRGLAALPKTISIRELPAALISLRIASGLSQRDFAKLTGVHESQVSRDERTDYKNITIDRINKICQALGVAVQIQTKLK